MSLLETLQLPPILRSILTVAHCRVLGYPPHSQVFLPASFQATCKLKHDNQVDSPHLHNPDIHWSILSFSISNETGSNILLHVIFYPKFFQYLQEVWVSSEHVQTSLQTFPNEIMSGSIGSFSTQIDPFSTGPSPLGSGNLLPLLPVGFWAVKISSIMITCCFFAVPL